VTGGHAARSGAERRVAAEERRTRRASEEDASVVMAAAANFLSVRMRSVAETRARLLHLGYPSGLVEATVSRLIELDYLDDTAFARTWVESRDRAHPRGQIRLRRELAIKGIGRDVVDLVLDERGSDIQDDDAVAGDGIAPRTAQPRDRSAADRTAALSLLKRRGSSLLREPDPRRRLHKAYSLLARNGFDPDICRVASAGFLGEGAAATDDEEADS
jgi:regulatory protein